MFNITNDVCEYCLIDLYNQVNELIIKEKPHWFSKRNGRLLSKYKDAYDTKHEKEMFRLSEGPMPVWKTYCIDCSVQMSICRKHLEQVISEMDVASKEGVLYNGEIVTYCNRSHPC
jgi:hypothetical protein